MPRRPGATQPTDPALPRVHLARDHARSVVAARLRAGQWERVRPGAYVDADLLTGDHRSRIRELARLVALDQQLQVTHVVSHESAALLWGLPTLQTPTAAHVIQASRSRVGRSPDVVRHVGHVAETDRTRRQGLAVTTLERTLVDCASSVSPAGGLIVADAALHRGANPAACAEILAGLSGRRGVVTARAVLAAADDGAESPGESLTRLALLRGGLPTPTTQIPVTTRLGTFWGDLGWPEWRVLVEYDGQAKYDSREALLAEKRREDALREAGWLVVRVVAVGLRRPLGLAARIRRLVPAARTAPIHSHPIAAV